MPPPGRRRPRPSLASALETAREPQPEWFLRRREEGWNGRFASDGPSYFDVPSAIAIGDEGSRMRRDVGRIRGGDGVGVAVQRSGTLAGKRARVRTNMTPSLSRGGARGGGSSSGTIGNTPDLYLMEKIYPEHPGPRSTAERGSGVRSLPQPPSHQGIAQNRRHHQHHQHHQHHPPRSIAYPDPREPARVTDSAYSPVPLNANVPSTLPGENAVVIVDGGESDGERSASGHADGGGRTFKDASAALHGQHHQQHQQINGGTGTGDGGQREGGLSGETTAGSSSNGADAGVLVAVTRAATGACMYREQLLVRLHALIDDWPMRSPGHSEDQVHHQPQQQERDTRRHSMKVSGPATKRQEQKKGSKKRRVKAVPKTTREDTTVQPEPGSKRTGGKAESSTDITLSKSGSGGSTTVASSVTGRSGAFVKRRGKMVKTGDGAQTRGAAFSGSATTKDAAERRPRAARNLTYLAGEIKKAGLSCVEKIVAWSLVVSPETCRPTPFRWSSQDYLAKMHTDLDFVSEALGRDAPSFGRGNPLLLTRSEAAGQPRAGQVGRCYAATYVILDAVNRARDAAAAARAAGAAGAAIPATLEGDLQLSTRESLSGQRRGIIEKERVDWGNGRGAGSGKGDGKCANLGGGGIGVIVVASDGASLGTIGEPSPESTRQQHKPEEQRPERKKKARKHQRQNQQQNPTKQRQPQVEEQQQQPEVQHQPKNRQQPNVDKGHRRANPDTGGVLEKGAGWSKSLRELPQEPSPEDVPDNDEDLSDNYGESFEDFEEEDVIDKHEETIPKQQLQQGDSEAQRVREKAEKMLQEKEEEEKRLREINCRSLTEGDGLQRTTSGGNGGNQTSETDATKVQQAEVKQRLRGKDDEREQDADIVEQLEVDAEQQLRWAQEREMREKAQEQGLRDEAELRRARVLKEQRLRDEEAQRVQVAEQQKARADQEQEERLRLEEMECQLREKEEEKESQRLREREEQEKLRERAAEEERLREEESQREGVAEAERQKLREQEADQQRAREEEAERRAWEDNISGQTEQMETEMVNDDHQKSGDVPTRIGQYDVECLLGDGAYGWVYKCRKRQRRGSSEETLAGVGSGARQHNRSSDKQEISPVVAIKQFKGLTDMEDEHTKNYVRLTQQREADLALSLLHPNIVRCLGTLTNGEAFGSSGDVREGESGGDGTGAGAVLAGVVDGGVRGDGGGEDGAGGGTASEVAFLMFEHVPGTLLDLIQERPGGLSLPMTGSLLRQLLSAVGFLHEHGIVHRDVKPENILVHKGNGRDGVPVLKLCDLGTARKVDEMMGLADTTAATTSNALRTWTEYVGSRWYRAPEMLAGSTDYGTGVDVWACACLAAEMSSGRPLFPGEDEGELAVSMAELLGPLPPDLASRLREMDYTPPPPRGRPKRSLEACLDGSTGDHEARRTNKGSSRASASLSSRMDDGAGANGPAIARNGNQLHASMLELLGGMLVFDPASRLSAKECLLFPRVFDSGNSATDVSFATGGDDAVGTGNGVASVGTSVAVGSRSSASTLTKGGGSEPTTRAVVGSDGGDGGGTSGGGLSFRGHIQATVEGIEVVSDLGDGQEDGNSVKEMAGQEGTESNVAGDVGDEDDDGGYDDDYDDEDADGVEDKDTSLVETAGADSTVAAIEHRADGQTSRDREAPQSKPLPPEETAFLGEEGYVRKRVVEIEQKEEYYNPGKQKEIASSGEPNQEEVDRDARTNARKSASVSSNWEDAGDDPISRDSGTIQQPPDPDALSNLSTYSAFDSAAAAFAAAAASTAVTIAEDVINAALADTSGARGSGGKDRPSQLQEGQEGSDSRDDGYFSAGNEEKDDEGKTIHEAVTRVSGSGNGRVVTDRTRDEPRATASSGAFDGSSGTDLKGEPNVAPSNREGGAAFGDEAYDSETFDEAEDEASGGALLDIGGRTSFFPDSSEYHPTAEDTTFQSQESRHGSGIIAEVDVPAQGEAPMATSRSSVSGTIDNEEPGITTEARDRPEAVEGNPSPVAGGWRAAAVADERAEEDDGADGDGWRVAGAFRVLSASGPGGELAARAAKGLLRRRNQREQQRGDLKAGEDLRHEDVENANAMFQQALKATGGKERHARRSIEQALATAPLPQGAATTTEPGQSMGGGAVNVRKSLEAFAASVVAVDGEGLSTPRLIRLMTGLARCVDTEFRDKAQKCQAWATQARQGKRPPGRGNGSALLECAEYLNSDSKSSGNESVAPQRRKKSRSAEEDGIVTTIDSGDGDSANGEVGNICAFFLVALCKAVDRGRASATADAVCTASRLEALSRVVCSLSPFVLDSDRPKADREEDLISVAVSIGFDEEMARQILLRPPASPSCLLSPAGQAVLVRAALCEGGERRVNIVTAREDALDQIEKALDIEFAAATEGSIRSTTNSVAAGGGRSAPSHVAASAALVLNPYYLSPWGKKKVLGKRVEEGEGLGPRKELFELAARQLSERWRSPPALSSSPLSKSPSASSSSANAAVTSSLGVTGIAREGKAEVELVIKAEPSSSSDGAGDVPGAAFAFLARIKAGWRIKVGGQTRTLESIEKERNRDGSIRCSARVTRLWMDSFQSEEVYVQEACHPVLVYQQGSESNWLDATADRSNIGTRTRLRTLGTLLALSVTNACRFPVELPDLFFRWLLLGGKASTQEPSHSFQPSVEDMVSLDQSLARPFEALKDAVQIKGALEGLLEIEGLPPETPAAEYIAHMVRQTFLEPLEWQVSEIRSAFFRTLSSSPLQDKSSHSSSENGIGRIVRLLPRPTVLAEMIRGRSPLCGDHSYGGGGGVSVPFGAGESEERPPQTSHQRETAKDFDFREVFLVHEDRDLVACAPLREAFWSVVHSDLSSEERRLLLLFITGTDRLPEAGCEAMSIEIPFAFPGGGEGSESSEVVARKALGQVPTAHTCDNVLELPNYWTILMHGDGRDEKTPTSAIPTDDRKRLEERLREVLASRLRVALNNATGYALDDLDDDSDAEYTAESQEHDPQRPADRSGGDDPPATRSEEEDFLAIPSLDEDDDDVPEQGGTAVDGALPKATKPASTPAVDADDDSDEDEDFSRFLDREQRDRGLGGHRRSENDVATGQPTGKPYPGSEQAAATHNSAGGGASAKQDHGRRRRTQSSDAAGGGEIGDTRSSLSTAGLSDGSSVAGGTRMGEGSTADGNQNHGRRHSGSDQRRIETRQDAHESSGSPGDGKVGEGSKNGEKSGVGGDGGYFDDDSIDFDIDDLEDLEM